MIADEIRRLHLKPRGDFECNGDLTSIDKLVSSFRDESRNNVTNGGLQQSRRSKR